MPIYEYECNSCKRITEAIKKFSDPAITDCPHCKGRLQKLVSLSSFHLKGSGWYVTDYAGKNAAKQSAKGTVGEDSGGRKSEKAEKSESKGKDSAERQ